MSGAKVTMLLTGVPQLLRAIELTDAGTRARTIAAIEQGTKRVAAGARVRAPKVSGELAATIRDEYSKDRMIGYVKAGFGILPRTTASRAMGAASRARALSRQQRNALRFAAAKSSRAAMAAMDLGVYAPVVEHGDPRRHHKPHPFLIPAFAAERPSIIEDIGNATKAGAKDGGLA